MKILFATSEVVPFAKTGGLADVCGALPAELAQLGNEVSIFLPAYREAIESGQSNERVELDFKIPIGNKQVKGHLLKSRLPGTNVTVYLVEQDDYYDRPQLYREQNKDYKDNCERFVFFCRSVMEAIRLLDLRVDLIHCNDWQTGLIPAYLRIEYAGARGYENIATVMTIHNMAYQGQFWHWDMLLTGLDWKYFNWHQLEFFGKLNLLKTGLVFADAINTVSPRYAQEIQSAPMGCGLEGVLAHRSHFLHGILNGVDYSVWNPATDEYLPLQYGPNDWQQGKTAAKNFLRKELGLPLDDKAPLIGMIGRLADQKGLDLVVDVLPQWLQKTNVQWIVLGSGEEKYHEIFRRLATQFPDKLAVQLKFSNPLAHCIEAAADMFLMPSLYEPCGLNQLYSLKYGTVPIVRATGGLADTIMDTDERTIADGSANGFVFESYQSSQLDQTLQRAVRYYQDKTRWANIVSTGMHQNWSWTRSAHEYLEMYRKTAAQVKQTTYY